MARSNKMGGEFLGADAIDSSLVHHVAGTKPQVQQVDADEQSARRKELLDELAELRQSAADELSQLKSELDEAVKAHEAILEIGRRRERLGANFTTRRDYWRETEGRLIRQIEAATPAIIRDAIDDVKKFSTTRDARGRERCEAAISRLQRLVMAADASKEDVKAILADLYAGEVEAI